ncbi:MAG: diaminopimelate decarboxylase, partial [Desulfobacterales bacterium]
FKTRLYPLLPAIVDHFGTPFHIYDETGIRATGEALKTSFAQLPEFREYFAVKALPNPRILRIMGEMGFGFDCSSVPELVLSRQVGGRNEDLMFTSNNTTPEEFAAAAAEGGSIINLDDITLLAKLPRIPELICFRYNPGTERGGNAIIGKPEEAKYGLTRVQLRDAYRQAQAQGVKRFGLHTMLASNELDYSYMVQTAEMLLEIVKEIAEALDIAIEFVNIGGGLGINYRPEEAPLDLAAMAREITARLKAFEVRFGRVPKLYMESGRYMTGPHGALVTRAINRKEIYRTYVGLDANMSALMRPAMYGAYHHITVPAKRAVSEREVVDVVGALCENNDKFAIQRELPPISDGDIVCIHDTGAHGHSMGFNYNGRLRPQELLLCVDGSVERIRRAETIEDYVATLTFVPKKLSADHLSLKN